jgi:hypothetical protein
MKTRKKSKENRIKEAEHFSKARGRCLVRGAQTLKQSDQELQSPPFLGMKSDTVAFLAPPYIFHRQGGITKH